MLLIIQGTGFCNLDCAYCYLPNRSDKRRISLDTIRQLVRRLEDHPLPDGELSVVWHAGEPLVMPVGFYEDAFAAFTPLTRRGIAIRHHFQTNGTLIDARWVAFFLKHRPIVGVSLDGPEEIHDRERKYRDGRGSWQSCMAGIRRLQAAGIPFHTISVLTEAALRRPDELFDFFVAERIPEVAFNIEEREGANTRASLPIDELEALYGAFLRRFLQRNVVAGHPLCLREAERVALTILAGGAPENPQVEPGAILSVDTRGNVATFSPELLGQANPRFGDFIIGNVWNEAIDAMLEGAVARTLAAEIDRGVARCRASCEFFPFCKGGAPANKLSETGSFASTETIYCRLTVKATIEACVDFLLTSPADVGERERVP